MQPHNHSNDYSDYMPCPIVTCFGCVNGYCTIIFGDAGNGCFYKDRTEALWQIRHCFYQLISQERFDLLYRYADTYAELGLMDKEINEIYQKQAELDAFRSSDISETDDMDEYSTYLDIEGRIDFHGKTYDLSLNGIHYYEQNVLSDTYTQNYIPKYPGIRANQLLIPELSGMTDAQKDRRLDKEAAWFLKTYCPAALETVMPVPIRKIADQRWQTDRRGKSESV